MAVRLASLQSKVGLGWYLQQQRKRRKEDQQAPEVLAQPTIGGGTSPTQTAEVFADSSFRGAEPITLSYQWQVSGVDIPGATLKALTLLFGMIGQTIRCLVTATNAFGTASVFSVSVVVVA